MVIPGPWLKFFLDEITSAGEASEKASPLKSHEP